MEDNNLEESNQKLEAEVAPALIAIHPTQKFVSVAVGSNLRVFNFQDGSGVSLVDENGGHKDSIRAIRYSKSGQLLVSAGDDKLVKIWNTNSWHCIYSVVSEKRVSAVAISNDEMFVCFADKFGVVYVVDIRGYCDSGNAVVVNKKAVPILSHYCSIVTRLEFSPDGIYIVSADRDFKIRVTLFPKKPLDGAHEIQSFCLGHTEFVTCLAFVSSQDHSQDLLVSGSGDSTIRLWEYASGSLLDTFDIGAKVESLPFTGRQEEETLSAVTDLCTTSDGSVIAVAIQSLSGIVLLRCNLSTRALSLAKVIPFAGEAFIPTSLGASPSVPLLWMVMGASSLHINNSECLIRVRVLSSFSLNNLESAEHETLLLEDTKVPGGEPLLQELQRQISIGNEAFKTAAEAVKTSMRNLMIKKQYSVERREFRKRGRNDKKNHTV